MAALPHTELAQRGQHRHAAVLLLKDRAQIDHGNFFGMEVGEMLPGIIQVGRRQPLRLPIQFDLDAADGQEGFAALQCAVG